MFLTKLGLKKYYFILIYIIFNLVLVRGGSNIELSIVNKEYDLYHAF